MRVDVALLLVLAAAVVVSAWVRGVDGPDWPVWASVAGALAYAVRAGRLAPPPSSPGSTVPGDVRPAVLIPVKDNAATVGKVAARAKAHGFPVYVVDDGSGDGSGDRAREAGAIVLRHEVNRGKGVALLTGMAAAAKDGCTHAICLDADGQHDPDDLPAFARAVREEPAAIFVGVRDLSTAPGRSRFGRTFSNFWIWAETGWRVGDSQCGFRAYPVAAVDALGLAGRGYDLEVEVLTRAIWRGTPVRDLPCRVHYPPEDERVSSFDPLRDNVRISVMNTRLFLGRVFWPPRWIPRIRQPRAAWTGRSRGPALGWRFVVALLRVSGRRAAYAFVTFLAAWYALFAATPGVRRYLARVGDGSLFAVYRDFAVALVDRAAFLLRGPEAFRYVGEGMDEIIRVFAAGEGGILLTAHAGNPEVSGGGERAHERMEKLRVLRFEADGDHGRGLFAALPPAWQPRVIAVNRSEGFATLAVLRELRAGAVVAMHGDRLVDDRTVAVRFLGEPCRFPAGPYLLAALSGVPVVFMGCFKEGHDTYRIIGLPPRRLRFDRKRPREEQIREWAQEYADALEAMARRYPTQWYNFHDVWEA